MDTALNKVLGSLPDDTKVYVSESSCSILWSIRNANVQFKPGHEYTKGNYKFAQSVIQDEAIMKLEELVTNNKETQGKSTIGDEKVTCRLSRINFGLENLLFPRNIMCS